MDDFGLDLGDLTQNFLFDEVDQLTPGVFEDVDHQSLEDGMDDAISIACEQFLGQVASRQEGEKPTVVAAAAAVTSGAVEAPKVNIISNVLVRPGKSASSKLEKLLTVPKRCLPRTKTAFYKKMRMDAEQEQQQQQQEQQEASTSLMGPPPPPPQPLSEETKTSRRKPRKQKFVFRKPSKPTSDSFEQLEEHHQQQQQDQPPAPQVAVPKVVAGPSTVADADAGAGVLSCAVADADAGVSQISSIDSDVSAERPPSPIVGFKRCGKNIRKKKIYEDLTPSTPEWVGDFPPNIRGVIKQSYAMRGELLKNLREHQQVVEDTDRQIAAAYRQIEALKDRKRASVVEVERLKKTLGHFEHYPVKLD